MTTARALILMYHRVGDRAVGRPEDDVYRVTTASFAAQMELLVRQGYPVVPAPALDTADVPPRAVVLTFDDGWDSDVGEALPILRRHGLPASFFVSPALLGQEAYLSWDGVAQLQAEGMEVGSHGLDHTLLGEVPAAEATQQLLESRARLEERLGREIEAIALPGGSGGRRVARLAHAAGYRRVMGSQPGIASGGSLLLPRFAIRRGDGLAAFQAVVDRRLSPRVRHGARHLVLTSARRLLGPAFYEAVKGWFLDGTGRGPSREPNHG